MRRKKIISLLIATSLASSILGASSVKTYASTTTQSQSVLSALQAKTFLAANTTNSDFSPLLNALNKTQAIKNGELKNNSTISVKISDVDWTKLGITEDNQAYLSLILNALQNIPVQSDTKFSTANNITNTKSDTSITLGTPFTFSTWTSTDTSSSVPSQKVIIKLPTNLKALLANGSNSSKDISSQIGSKDYVYYDSSELSKASLAKLPQDANSKLYTNISNDFIQKLINQVISNEQVQNSGIITKNSDTEYELKLTNSSMISLLIQIVSDSTIQKIIIDYAVSVTQMSAKNSGKILNESDIANLRGSLTSFMNQIKSNIPEVEKALSGINFNLDVKYTIGSDGYISSQNGSFDLKIDGKTLTAQSKVSDTETNNPSLSLKNANIDISFTFSNTLSDLGNSATIDPMPTVSADNSLDISALLAQSIKDSVDKSNKDLEKAKAQVEIKNKPSKFTKKTSNNQNKSWSIKFGRALDSSTVTDSSVMIVDDDLNIVDCDLSVKDNTIIVTPKQTYSKNKNYHIYISDSLADTNGVHLQSTIHQDFDVQ